MDEKHLATYDRPIVAVDVILFTIIDNELKVILITRDKEPYKGMLALPGSFVGTEEELQEAVIRTIHDKIGVNDIGYLEQLYTFGDLERDPRARVVSIAYYVLVNDDNVRFDHQLEGVGWHGVNGLPRLAFDHDAILRVALERLRGKIEYTTIAFSLVPKQFTMAELKSVYDIIFGTTLDDRNFQKKMKSLGLLREVGKIKLKTKPAKLYELTKMNYTDKIWIFS